MDYIGQNKAHALRDVINHLLQEEITRSLDVDILNPGDKEPELVKNSIAIVDCTASVPVARRLAASEQGDKRTISLFLIPKGTALILLAADHSRNCGIDWLDMQYYLEISRNESLSDHLSTGSPTRYSNACRSVASQISQDAVAEFASIGPRELRIALTTDKAMHCKTAGLLRREAVMRPSERLSPLELLEGIKSERTSVAEVQYARSVAESNQPHRQNRSCVCNQRGAWNHRGYRTKDARVLRAVFESSGNADQGRR